MALKKKKKIKKTAKKSAKKLPKKKAKKTIKKGVKKPVKKQLKKRIGKKRPLSKKPGIKKSAKNEGILIGLITHYFPHVQAAVIKLKGALAKGDTVKIKGHTTDLTQIVTSMQIDRVDIQNAKKGDEIGLQVSSRVRQQDKVYKI
jgi:hypothetical protein